MMVQSYRVAAEINSLEAIDLSALRGVADQIKVDMLPQGRARVLFAAVSDDVDYPRMIQILEVGLGAHDVFVIGSFESSDLDELFKHSASGGFTGLTEGLSAYTTSDGTSRFSPVALRDAMVAAGASDAMALSLLGMTEQRAQQIHAALEASHVLHLNDEDGEPAADDRDEIPF